MRKLEMEFFRFQTWRNALERLSTQVSAHTTCSAEFKLLNFRLPRAPGRSSNKLLRARIRAPLSSLNCVLPWNIR
jgi:hypothetical protein